MELSVSSQQADLIVECLRYALVKNKYAGTPPDKFRAIVDDSIAIVQKIEREKSSDEAEQFDH